MIENNNKTLKTNTKGLCISKTGEVVSVENSITWNCHECDKTHSSPCSLTMRDPGSIPRNCVFNNVNKARWEVVTNGNSIIR
jgi:hypothetical protein